MNLLFGECWEKLSLRRYISAYEIYSWLVYIFLSWGDFKWVLLMAVGYSWSVQQGGTDENAVWDTHAKYQSTPLQSSSLIRLHKALEEQKLISGSKSAWKKAKQAWFTSLANPVPPGILDFCKPLHRSRSWAWVLALSAADSTWLRLLRQHSVRDLSCTMFGNFLRD